MRHRDLLAQPLEVRPFVVGAGLPPRPHGMLPPFCILLLHPSQALSREFSKRVLQLIARQRIDLLLADEPPAQRLLDGLSDVPLVHTASFEQIQNCPRSAVPPALRLNAKTKWMVTPHSSEYTYVAIMRPPCDEAVIRSASADGPCETQARSWILAATILGSSMAFIDSTVVNVALPSLQSELHATVVGVQWVVESYGLLLGALIVVGGSFGDLFGRRLMFLVGVGIFAAASLACGSASSIQQLVIARSAQGLGAAFLVPGSLSIISASFDEKTRGQAIGTWSGFTAITAAVGPVLGGWLIEHASWRWAFFINVPLAAAVIVISLWHIPESRTNDAGRIDWLGVLLATAGLGGVVYGFIESTNLGWTQPLVFGSLVAGFACLIAFAFAEARETSPMVPLKLFESRSFSGANLLTLFLYAALGIFFFLFPMNFIQVQGYSTTATGAATLPVIVLIFSLSRWSGGLVTRYGPRIPLVVGPLTAATGFVLFAVPGVRVSYWTGFFPAFVVLGFGMAISVAPLTTVVMSSVDRDRSGAASGINNAVARVAGVLAVALVGIAMVKLFSFSLNRSLTGELFPPGILHYVQSNAIKLAGLDLPSDLDSATATLVRSLISKAFVFGFRTLMLACAVLCLISAAIGSLMIPAGGGVGAVEGAIKE